MSCLFNSYDPYFKQPFGALRAGQTVRLTLCIPEELGYVDPHLVLQKEGKYDVPVHYRMKFDGQTPQQNHFSVELPLNDPGLYFYYFDLYTTSAASTAGRTTAALSAGRKAKNGRSPSTMPVSRPRSASRQGVLSDLPGPVLRRH